MTLPYFDCCLLLLLLYEREKIHTKISALMSHLLAIMTVLLADWFINWQTLISLRMVDFCRFVEISNTVRSCCFCFFVASFGVY